ncbi:MAG: OsmC family protein [Micavibrio aeruginosavorus]|uniref:OsmC family protein n=1 Tax=Micavibrio aeruginosavorus TaxID=349221 RepID=A0A7T5UHS1_9BACT|nr:MAG: OsmC family protein [Micavibrio aeruginosavorus]
MSGITKTTVCSSAEGKYQQKIQAGPHQITADEPRSLGGDGTGPTPISLMLGALGACTSMTLQMYAGRKVWPLEGVDVFLTHEKKDDHDYIAREVVIRGSSLTVEQRQRLMEIADKCPVHKMLSGSARITTSERPS